MIRNLCFECDNKLISSNFRSGIKSIENYSTSMDFTVETFRHSQFSYKKNHYLKT